MMTCCEYHEMNCNQGRDCPARQQLQTQCEEYAVRVVRPFVAPVHYTTRAANSTQAAQEAMDRHGFATRVSVRRVGT